MRLLHQWHFLSPCCVPSNETWDIEKDKGQLLTPIYFLGRGNCLKENKQCLPLGWAWKSAVRNTDWPDKRTASNGQEHTPGETGCDMCLLSPATWDRTGVQGVQPRSPEAEKTRPGWPLSWHTALSSETTSRPCWAGPCNGLIREAAVTGQVASSAQIRPSQLCTCFQMMQCMGPVYWPWKPRGKASMGITAPHTHLFLYESHLCPGGRQQTASVTLLPL